MARRAHIILGGAAEETLKMLLRPKNVITMGTLSRCLYPYPLKKKDD